MHALDEWKILVNTVTRRVNRGDFGPEESMILNVNKVLNYMLSNNCDYEAQKARFTAVINELNLRDSKGG